MSSIDQRPRDIQRAALDAAGLESGQDLEDGKW
jgi:hypothetical protein